MSGLQEVTLNGVHVRSIRYAEIGVNGFDDVFCVSPNASCTMAALGTESSVILLDIVTGSVVRSFGRRELSQGQLSVYVSVRFMPDGAHLLVADSRNSRLSLYSIAGEFVRCIGVGTLACPMDTCFASNGDIVVVDNGMERVCVFAADGSSLLRSFGSFGEEEGQFTAPTALAMYEDKVCVLDFETNRVQMFV